MGDRYHPVGTLSWSLGTSVGAGKPIWVGWRIFWLTQCALSGSMGSVAVVQGSPWVQGAPHVVAGASFSLAEYVRVRAVGSWIWELPCGPGAAHMGLGRLRCIPGCLDGRLGRQLRACILVPGSWVSVDPMEQG